jgi:hypothetical protein
METDLLTGLDKWLADLPVVVDDSLANEASVRLDGIHVGRGFAARSAGHRRAVLLHEAAHWRGLDDWYLKTHEDWDLAAKTSFGHLNGQTTPGEIMVEAYATAWMEPAFLWEHAPALVALVKEGAQAVGLPVPPGMTKDEVGVDRDLAAGN